MAQIKWTDPALNDLDEIAKYIALSNLSAAKKLVESVFDKTTRLEIFPESGRLVPELEHSNYREIIVNPCRIIYTVKDDDVLILHVMRQERDLRKFLLQE